MFLTSREADSKIVLWMHAVHYNWVESWSSCLSYFNVTFLFKVPAVQVLGWERRPEGQLQGLNTFDVSWACCREWGFVSEHVADSCDARKLVERWNTFACLLKFFRDKARQLRQFFDDRSKKINMTFQNSGHVPIHDNFLSMKFRKRDIAIVVDDPSKQIGRGTLDSCYWFKVLLWSPPKRGLLALRAPHSWVHFWTA